MLDISYADIVVSSPQKDWVQQALFINSLYVCLSLHSFLDPVVLTSMSVSVLIKQNQKFSF